MKFQFLQNVPVNSTVVESYGVVNIIQMVVFFNFKYLGSDCMIKYCILYKYE